jgi:hypothetical protein
MVKRDFVDGRERIVGTKCVAKGLRNTDPREIDARVAFAPGPIARERK